VGAEGGAVRDHGGRPVHRIPELVEALDPKLALSRQLGPVCEQKVPRAGHEIGAKLHLGARRDVRGAKVGDLRHRERVFSSMLPMPRSNGTCISVDAS
jgi:hypothetical protein